MANSPLAIIVLITLDMRGARSALEEVKTLKMMEQEMVVMQDIFTYVQEGIDESARARGCFTATGVRPSFMPKLEAAGIRLPANIFRQRIMLRD